MRASGTYPQSFPTPNATFASRTWPAYAIAPLSLSLLLLLLLSLRRLQARRGHF
ncbi:MAG: hypothetical protein LBO66_01615 [Deltaproteobacteria bacterium]|nr:hypothetical protein [Deltaproteobacteria bacterium]